jgi:predicted amidohydrolase YtcJ
MGPAARWRIEHAQALAPSDIPRFAALGVIASMQPSHAISDLHFAPGRAQALHMLARAPAVAAFEEISRGALEPGKRADLSAFSVDLMRAPFADIPRARAVLTISDGATVHDAR